MGFFKEFNDAIGEGTITLSITKKKDRMYVLLIPKIDSETMADNIAPMNISGTPESLDTSFIDAVKSSLDLCKGITVEVAMFEKTIKAAAEEVKNKATKSNTAGKKKPEISGQTSLIPSETDGPGNSDEMNLEDESFNNDEETIDQDSKEPEKKVNKPASRTMKEPRKPGTTKQTDPVQAGSSQEPKPVNPAAGIPAAEAPAADKITPAAGNETKSNEPIIPEDEEW